MTGPTKQGKAPSPSNDYGSPSEESNRLFRELGRVRKPILVQTPRRRPAR